MGKAVLIMFVAMSMIPAGDTAAKLLMATHDVTPVFVGWSRFLIGALAVLPFVPGVTWVLFGDWRIWIRGIILAVGITSIQMALSTEPIADVFAAFFIGPIFSYALSVIFLRERVTRLRTALMVLGFLGVLLVVRPGLGGSSGLIFAVIAGLCYGAFLTMSRWLSNIAPPVALVFTQLAISAAFLAPFALNTLPVLTAPVVGLTLLSGLFSMAGNLLLLFAYRIAPATQMAPLIYFQLIAATILGWTVFSDLPDIYTWIGLSLVIGSGIASAFVRR
jgi:drug/metabolite transporter (DMT)-like permease